MPLVSASSLKTAILLVDIQSAFRVPGYFGQERNNPQLEENVQRLLEKTRAWNSQHNSVGAQSVEIVHVHHHSTNSASALHPSFVLPDDPAVHGVDPLPCANVLEGEPVFTKNVNSAFIGTSVEQYIRDKRVRQLLICGITTDHCVSTTVRMAANLRVVDSLDGSEEGTIFLIDDACALFGKGDFSAELMHNVHVESLRGEFAETITTEDVIRNTLVKE